MADELEREKQRLQVAKWDENERKLRDELKLDLPPRSLSADAVANIDRFARWRRKKASENVPASHIRWLASLLNIMRSAFRRSK